MTVRQSTAQMVPAEFVKGEGDCQYLRVATIRAIGCEYIVWVNYEKTGSAAYVVCSPTDGPFDVISTWGNQKRRVVTFTIDGAETGLTNWKVNDAAVSFAAKSASDDYLAEIS